MRQVKTNDVDGGRCNRHTGAILVASEYECLSTGSFFDTILNGYSNTICTASHCNTILNGYSNSIGNGTMYSAILGGSGNSIPGGMSYVSVFGCNITAVRNCSMHVNNIVAQNMVDMTCGGPPLPAGTLYFCLIGGLKQVFIV